MSCEITRRPRSHAAYSRGAAPAEHWPTCGCNTDRVDVPPGIFLSSHGLQRSYGLHIWITIAREPPRFALYAAAPTLCPILCFQIQAQCLRQDMAHGILYYHICATGALQGLSAVSFFVSSTRYIRTPLLPIFHRWKACPDASQSTSG